MINALEKEAGKLENAVGLYERAVKQGIKNQNAKTAKPGKQNKKAPERSYNNKVYGGDAWTPTFPKEEYKINEKLAYKNYKRANSLGSVPFFNPVTLHPNNVEDIVNRLHDGETLIDRYRDDYGFKNAFLKDATGEAVIIKTETVKTEKTDRTI